MEQELEYLVSRLTNPPSDFTETFLLVSQLRKAVAQKTEHLTVSVIDCIEDVILSPTHQNQRGSFILYREAASIIIDIKLHSGKPGLIVYAEKCTKKLLSLTGGSKLLAISDANCLLPIKTLKLPNLPEPQANYFEVSLSSFLSNHGLSNGCHGTWKGRSQIFSLSDGTLLVIKMLRKNEIPENVMMECLWMDYLGTVFTDNKLRFDIPKPINKNGSYLLKFVSGEFPEYSGDELHSEKLAIAFISHSEYFDYPNPEGLDFINAPSETFEIFSRVSSLLGKLSSMGILHNALIPLFHNRTQRGRRDDEGIYDWVRAGRLDRWLASSEFPNFGKTGLRDFEHFEFYKGSTKQIYKQIGTHFLSMVLVAGSCFRMKEPLKRGYNAGGKPLDSRMLFDKSLYAETIKVIFESYYTAFTDQPLHDDCIIDYNALSESLIEKMGLDTHMKEILRVADQNEMTDEDFNSFLLSKSFSSDAISGFKKGKEDITTYSGPHLGGFNSSISTPELIDFTGKASSLCLLGKHGIEVTGNIQKSA